MYSQTVITHKNCPFCNYKLFIFQRLPRIKVIKKKKKKYYVFLIVQNYVFTKTDAITIIVAWN